MMCKVDTLITKIKEEFRCKVNYATSSDLQSNMTGMTSEQITKLNSITVQSVQAVEAQRQREEEARIQREEEFKQGRLNQIMKFQYDAFSRFTSEDGRIDFDSKQVLSDSLSSLSSSIPAEI